MAKKGLGKGINSLLGDYSMPTGMYGNDESNTTGSSKDAEQTVVMLGLQKIKSNPGQPRKYFDDNALKELSESIKEQGVLQPILVEESTETPDKYVIVAGERRFRAAKIAGLTHIPSLIKDFSEEQRLEVALIENIQRENLNPIEEAQAYRFLIEQVSLSQENLAKRLGKKRSTIANSLRLLNLNEEMKEALEKGEISAGHARSILSVVNPADRKVLFEKIIGSGLSVRQAEQEAKQLNDGSRAAVKKKKTVKKEKPADLRRVEERFLHSLGTKVELKGSIQKGKLEISYYSPEDLQRLYQIIGGDENLFN